jgi:hypothetical protein
MVISELNVIKLQYRQMMEMLLEVKRETKNTNESIKRIESSSKNRNIVVLKVQLNITYICVEIIFKFKTHYYNQFRVLH